MQKAKYRRQTIRNSRPTKKLVRNNNKSICGVSKNGWWQRTVTPLDKEYTIHVWKTGVISISSKPIQAVPPRTIPNNWILCFKKEIYP